ncbi:MAG: hypothetical protein R2699_17400 [Acidimicrobiales bacterium]
MRFHAMRRTLWVATPEVARLAHASSTTKLLAPEHRRFVALLAANGIADDGDAWIASAKEQVLAALHRAGEASTRELGEAVPALRQPIAMAPGTRYATTQGAHGRVMLHLGFEVGRGGGPGRRAFVDQQPVPLGGDGRLGAWRHRRHGSPGGRG